MKIRDIAAPAIVWLIIVTAMGWMLWSKPLTIGEMIMVIGASMLAWALYGMILHLWSRRK